MRLSPPISVLTILAAAFAWMATFQGPLGCSVDSAWEAGRSSPASVSHCDPWVGIHPSMPISQIRIGPRVQYWVLLVRSDGTGYIAIEKPGRCGPPGSLECDIPRDIPTEITELRKKFIIHPFKDSQIYGKLLALLSPMRDFLGDMSVITFANELPMRSAQRRSYGCASKHLPSDPVWIEWGGDAESPDSFSFLNLSCETRATNAAGRRIRQSVEEVAQAANVPSAGLLMNAGLEGF